MDGIAVKLERLKREAQKEWKRKWRKKVRQAAPASVAEWRALGGEAVRALLKIALIIALPFAGLVRGSVFFYEHGTRAVWLALLTAAILTGGVVTAYAGSLARKFTSRGGRRRPAVVLPRPPWAALP